MPNEEGGRDEDIVFDFVLHGKTILTNLCPGDAKDLKEALAPLVARAALAERMAEAIRKYKMCRYDEDPGPYITELDNRLEEYDALAKTEGGKP